MATSISVQSVTEVGGKFFVRLTNGVTREYSSLENMKELVVGRDNDFDFTFDLFISWWLARSSDGSNKALIEGKTFTFDLSNPNPIRVQ